MRHDAPLAISILTLRASCTESHTLFSNGGANLSFIDLLCVVVDIVDSGASPYDDPKLKLKTLSALSLTCQCLREPCQKCLFRTLTLFPNEAEWSYLQVACPPVILWRTMKTFSQKTIKLLFRDPHRS
ncbi:hypothetical protein CPB84DRAFT_1405506 [Gymnopilus junonius]|uniref:Uncharacterized protein n=1 Tax=Gymnopilus junonius TaxID=109634 RepID=A0A9P5TJX3_GYMJU|nr:hypothetical protein CPB84DRAFT_1405506 [Gymnopilus junonius]